MKFLKKWLYNAVTSYDRDERKCYAVGADSATLGTACDVANELEHITLTIASARGGLVINSRFYDKQRDRNVNTAYVIHEGGDTVAEISKIITMEMVKM